jgi:uncharacterized protein YeeX (DUF496 family)
MTLPNEDFKTVLETLRIIRRKHQLRVIDMAIDAGVSSGTISLVLNYSRYIPGRYVEEKLRAYVKKLKLKYPKDCPQEAIKK